MIKNSVSGSKSTPTGINTPGNGKIIKDMEKGPFGKKITETS